ncbi:MAG TPA: ABC transporter permease [Candidatus Pygmaiobacter gallistercoris]|nr:ABC transporter permease [Candidatus Pygmaiobacter gallistercoris]
MLRYIGKRLLQMIPILLVVAILIFTLMQFVKGDPVQIMLGDSATQTQIEQVREELGLNRPFLVKLGSFLNDLIHFDFGESYMTRMKVVEELMLRFPNTLILALMSVLISICLGVPIGIRSALKANKLEDRFWMFVTLLANSMPGFWLALLLVLLFSVWLDLLPSSGIGGIQFFILPVLSGSIGSIASIARQTRSSMLEVIRADFVTTAISKGLSQRDVIWKHALPNALIPIITITGSSIGLHLGGTAITESIFSIPGIGLYMLNGINSRDYPVVQGCIIYLAFTFSIMMLVTDLVYAFVDPRIKAQYMRRSKKKTKSAETAKSAA